MKIDTQGVGLWTPLDLGASGVLWLLLVLMLVACGSAAGASIGYTLAVLGRARRWPVPSSGESPWLGSGALAGLLLAVCGRGWGLGVPLGLAIPALWTLGAFLVLPSQAFTRRAGAIPGWDRTRLLILPLAASAWAVLAAIRALLRATRRLADRLQPELIAVEARVAAVAAGALLVFIAATTGVPAIGHHVVAVLLGGWLAVLVALWMSDASAHPDGTADRSGARARGARPGGRPAPPIAALRERLRPWLSPGRLLTAGPVLGLVTASELWRQDIVLANAWAPALACVAALTALLVHRVHAGDFLTEGRAADRAGLAHLARPVLLAGLLGLGAGALVMPDPHRWVGVGAIAVGLMVVGVTRSSQRSDSPETDSAGSPEATPDRRRWWALAGLCAGALMAAVDTTALTGALPTIGRDFGAGIGELAWAVDAYLLGLAPLVLTMGSLGDRLGRRRMFWVGMVLFAVSSLWAARSASIEGLVAARALQGLAAALLLPAGLPTLAKVFPRGELGKATRVWTLLGLAGLPVGFVFGGWLVETAGWPWIFLLNLPVVAFALAAAWWVIPESRSPRARRLDPVGVLASLAGLLLVVWSLIESRSASWGDARVMVALGAGAALLALFVWWEHRLEAGGRDPLLPVSLFKDRHFAPATATLAAMYSVLLGAAFLVTFYLQSVLGLGPLEAGVRLLPVIVGAAATNLLAGRLVSWLGRRVVLTCSMGLIALAAILLWSGLSLDTGYWTPLGICLVLIGAGMGAGIAVATHSITEALPEDEAGVAAAMDQTSRYTGLLVGVAIWASAHGHWYGFDGSAIDRQGFVDAMALTAIWVGAPVALLGALVALRLPRAERSEPAERDPDRNGRAALRRLVRRRDGTPSSPGADGRATCSITGTGSGPVLMNLRGFLANASEWTRARERLTRSGYGGAGYIWADVEMPWTLPGTKVGRRGDVLALAAAQRRDMINRLATAYPGRPIVPIGHSFGGGSVLTEAAEVDPRVPGLIAIAPVGAAIKRSIFLLILRSRWLQALRWVPWLHALLPKLRSPVTTLLSRKPGQMRRVAAAFVGRLTDIPVAARAFWVGPRTLDALEESLPPGEVRVPVRIWVGDRDGLVDAGLANHVWTLSPLVKVTVAKSQGHSPQLTSPDELADWIDETVLDLVRAPDAVPE